MQSTGATVTPNEIRKDLGPTVSGDKGMKRRFGAKSALDYLIREKLVAFADDAERHPEFAKELPRFMAAVWQVFNQYELAGYIATQKPAKREQLRRLLFMK